MQPRKLTLMAAVLCATALASCEKTEIDTYPCPDGMDCSGQPPMRKYTGSTALGGPCQASGDCSSGTCITKALLTAMGVDTTYVDVPNGLCSKPSCTVDADCGEGGTCANGVTFGNPDVTLCLPTCNNITDCRWKEDYSCYFQAPESPASGVCLPDSVIAATICPTGCP